MSSQSSVHNYNKAYQLFTEVDKFWSETEKSDGRPTEYQFVNILDKLEDLQKSLDRVDIREVEDHLNKIGKPTLLPDVKENMGTMKEGTHYLSKVILAWSYEDELLSEVPKKIAQLQKKNSLKYEGNRSDLSKAFVKQILHPDNIERQKSNIASILRRTITLQMFERLYNSLMSGIKIPSSTEDKKPIDDLEENPKTKKFSEDEDEDVKSDEETKERYPDLPREAPKEGQTPKTRKTWIITPDGKKHYYDFETKNIDGVVTYYNGKEEVYSYLEESFMNLKEYKKLHS